VRSKLLVGATASLCALVVTTGVLWIWKPWVPPVELADPGPTGRRVQEHGVFGNYYPAADAPVGAILLIGGSEGGITRASDRTAESLQQRGYSVLVASYFGGPGQPAQLERIPLETFDDALAWLTSQPRVQPDRVAVMGTSKGAEAALLIGQRHPEVRAVVAAAPSSAVWPGIRWNTVNALNADSSWTAGGQPLPDLPYGPFDLAILAGRLGHLYADAVDRLDDHPEAALRIEEIQAPVLLICGELDRLWPSCPMARQLVQRANAAGHPPVQLLAHQRVGHADFAPPYPGTGPAPRWGGSAAAANEARTETWPTVLEFLGSHLAS
jgi:uncharacterized protein